MVRIVERKRDRDVIFGFVTVICALAAWRGWSGARGIAVVLLVAAVGAAGAWWWMRRQPLAELIVTPEEIAVVHRGVVERRISRPDAETLVFRSAGNHAHRTWHLTVSDGDVSAGISMMGFRPQEVGAACRDQGWVFASDSVF